MKPEAKPHFPLVGNPLAMHRPGTPAVQGHSSEGF